MNNALHRRDFLTLSLVSVGSGMTMLPAPSTAFLPQLLLRIFVGSALRSAGGAAARAAAGSAARAAAGTAARSAAGAGARAVAPNIARGAVTGTEKRIISEAIRGGSARQLLKKPVAGLAGASAVSGISEAEAAVYFARAQAFATENPSVYSKVVSKIGDIGLGLVIEKGMSLWLTGEDNEAAIHVANQTNQVQIGQLNVVYERMDEDNNIIYQSPTQWRSFTIHPHSEGRLEYLTRDLPFEGLARLNIRVVTNNPGIAAAPSDEFLMIS